MNDRQNVTKLGVTDLFYSLGYFREAAGSDRQPNEDGLITQEIQGSEAFCVRKPGQDPDIKGGETGNIFLCCGDDHAP